MQLELFPELENGIKVWVLGSCQDKIPNARIVFSISGIPFKEAQRLIDYSLISSVVLNPTGVKNPFPPEHDFHEKFQTTSTIILDIYQEWIENGIYKEFCDGILPLNVHCTVTLEFDVEALKRVLKTDLPCIGLLKHHVSKTWPWFNFN